jgi:hypothetical protein
MPLLYQLRGVLQPSFSPSFVPMSPFEISVIYQPHSHVHVAINKRFEKIFSKLNIYSLLNLRHVSYKSDVLVTRDADHGSRGMNCFRSLESWDRGFESHSSYGCLCTSLFCLCCPVCRWRSCDGLITRPRSPTVGVKNDYGTKEEARALQGL